MATRGQGGTAQQRRSSGGSRPNQAQAPSGAPPQSGGQPPAAAPAASASTALVSIRDARAFLTDPRVMEQLSMAASKAITPDRLIRVALTAMSKNPALLNCTKESLVLALMESACLGLLPTGTLGEGYLVPYRNKKNGNRLEAQFQVGYRGLVKLARRSGTVHNVMADVVREGDFFEWEKGLVPKLTHRTAPAGTRGKATHAWACAYVPEGPPPFEVMDIEQIDAIRRRSKSAEDGPWVTDYNEMAKKTVIRRLSKSLELSTEAEAAIAHDDAVEFGAQGGRISHTMLNFDVPEPERTDVQGRSKNLAQRLGAEDPEADDEVQQGETEAQDATSEQAADPSKEPITDKPTLQEMILFEKLLARAVDKKLLTFDQSTDYEVAKHDENGPGVRSGIEELLKMLKDAGESLDDVGGAAQGSLV